MNLHVEPPKGDWVGDDMEDRSCINCVFYVPNMNFSSEEYQLKNALCFNSKNESIYGRTIRLCRQDFLSYETCGTTGKFFEKKPRDIPMPEQYDFVNNPPEVGQWAE